MPKNFFLWEHLKYVSYKTPLKSIEELKQRITEGCRNISPARFQSERQEFMQ